MNKTNKAQAILDILLEAAAVKISIPHCSFMCWDKGGSGDVDEDEYAIDLCGRNLNGPDKFEVFLSKDQLEDAKVTADEIVIDYHGHPMTLVPLNPTPIQLEGAQ